jgi:CRP-like cAMP-binding protein
MNPEKLIQFFQSSGLVSEQKSKEIASSFIAYSLCRNDYFLRAGKISHDYFFLEKGFMRSFAYDTNGNDVTTNFYGESQVVFEVSSFFNRIPSQENIQALTDCEGWVIKYEQLNQLFHGLPEFREFGRHLLVRGFAALKLRMLSMITETAEERYERLLNTNPEIFRYAPLKYIASFLGITDTSLSRIRKEFSKNKSS